MGIKLTSPLVFGGSNYHLVLPQNVDFLSLLVFTNIRNGNQSPVAWQSPPIVLILFFFAQMKKTWKKKKMEPGVRSNRCSNRRRRREKQRASRGRKKEQNRASLPLGRKKLSTLRDNRVQKETGDIKRGCLIW